MSKKISLIFILTLCLQGSLTWAQSSSPPSSTHSIKRTVATVVLCGLGGAVLGLSTLSFYSDPQERISNITTGFALGLIGGSVYMVSRSTQPSPRDTRDYSQQTNPFSDLDQMRVRAQSSESKSLRPMEFARFEF